MTSMVMASMASMVAWSGDVDGWMASMASMASNGGFNGVDGVDGGRVASMASNGGVEWWWTGVFDTEGTDVEVPLCPQW